MKKIIHFLLLFFISFSINAQTKPIRLIVRGDDMGFSHSGNLALIKAFKEGIETSIEVIAPSPWFPEAVRLLQENPSVDVGLHLTLTSEWDNIKWRPLTNAPSLVDSSGFFFPMIWPNKNYPQGALLEHQFKLEDIEQEWRAQIELAKRQIPRISHISGHMGCTALNDSVKALARRLAQEYNMDIDLETLGVKGVGYNGPSKSGAEKVAAFVKMLEGLQVGNAYIVVDHPGLNTPELQAIHHIGYENVADDRQGVTDAWTHPQVKAVIKKRGIKLISYKELLLQN